MASLYGVEYTNVTQDVPSEKAAHNKWNAPLRIMYDSYTFASDLSADDKIYLGKLPKGARVIDVILAVTALGGGTIDVGYEYNATGESALTDNLDAFLDGVDVTNAANFSMSEDLANADGFAYEIEGDADIVATIATDTSASSGTIKLCVIYAAS